MIPPVFNKVQIVNGSVKLKDSSLCSKDRYPEFSCNLPKEVGFEIFRIFYDTHSPYKDDNVRQVCKLWYQIHKNVYANWPELVIAKTILQIQKLPISEIMLIQECADDNYLLMPKSIKEHTFPAVVYAEAGSLFLQKLSQIKNEELSENFNQLEIYRAALQLKIINEDELAVQELMETFGNSFVLKSILYYSNYVRSDLVWFINSSLDHIFEKLIIYRDVETSSFLHSLEILKNTPYASHAVDSICNFFALTLWNLNQRGIDDKDTIFLISDNILFECINTLCYDQKYQSFEHDLVRESLARSFLNHCVTDLTENSVEVKFKDQEYWVNLDKINQIPFIQIRLYILQGNMINEDDPKIIL